MNEPSATHNQELLPCPFCSGAAVFCLNAEMLTEREPHENYGGRWIECQGCRTCTNIQFGENQHALLRELWNRRAGPQSQLTDALRDMLRQADGYGRFAKFARRRLHRTRQQSQACRTPRLVVETRQQQMNEQKGNAVDQTSDTSDQSTPTADSVTVATPVGESARLTPEQEALYDLMSDISEDCYCAGWMSGNEFRLWRALVDPTDNRHYGQDVITPENAERLRYWSEKIGGWIYWHDDAYDSHLPADEWGPRFIPLAAWEQRYAQYNRVRGSA